MLGPSRVLRVDGVKGCGLRLRDLGIWGLGRGGFRVWRVKRFRVQGFQPRL